VSLRLLGTADGGAERCLAKRKGRAILENDMEGHFPYVCQVSSICGHAPVDGFCFGAWILVGKLQIGGVFYTRVVVEARFVRRQGLLSNGVTSLNSPRPQAMIHA
jgi:hypothetical protein